MKHTMFSKPEAELLLSDDFEAATASGNTIFGAIEQEAEEISEDCAARMARIYFGGDARLFGNGNRLNGSHLWVVVNAS